MYLQTALDVVSFAGIAILSVPTLKLDRLKRAKMMLADEVARRKTEHPRALDGLVEERAQLVAARADRWNPVDRACLYTGYACLFGSSLVRIFT